MKKIAKWYYNGDLGVTNVRGRINKQGLGRAGTEWFERTLWQMIFTNSDRYYRTPRTYEFEGDKGINRIIPVNILVAQQPDPAFMRRLLVLPR